MAKFKKCEACGQESVVTDTFLCKGRMICQACFMQETKGNTLFFDESKYPRSNKKALTDEEIEGLWKKEEVIKNGK